MISTVHRIGTRLRRRRRPGTDAALPAESVARCEASLLKGCGLQMISLRRPLLWVPAGHATYAASTKPVRGTENMSPARGSQVRVPGFSFPVLPSSASVPNLPTSMRIGLGHVPNGSSHVPKDTDTVPSGYGTVPDDSVNVPDATATPHREGPVGVRPAILTDWRSAILLRRFFTLL